MHELRWSGIHRMPKRYKQLQPYLFLFERDCEVDRCIPEDTPEDDTRRFPIVQYLPSPEDHCTILDRLDDMNLLELATKRLQARNLTLVATLVDFPEMADRLKADADIVESPAFEIGVVKIMQGRDQDLTAEEAVAVVRLQRFPEEETNTPARVPTSKRKRNRNVPGRTRWTPPR
ncbi:hypothetical protein PHYSODRAFT_354667 [Phytophthora sojae]|uniref:Uncharacterized protein n=1 Tax=Phytophthora sojae (strain P6497) TaxID=1094619 RepID=G4ZDK9_PHYSP|nr:hypothetical protein PHYSODRAFT_354667 [Phytophthora sojae]EGZ18348.1 hypothetical protein PHYSODRAFT_354667 [Phytophthora sojae]|eukprot:XP_009527406.1 hypothetical protein PHYSODRAFT_354667 [Phytophthora sojae]